LSNAGGGIERLLNPPDEHRRIHPTAPAIRLDATGAFFFVSQRRRSQTTRPLTLMAIASCAMMVLY